MWIFPASKDSQDIVDEIAGQSDRGAALIASALLEDALTELLKTQLICNKTLEAKMFKGSGPLATYSAKIDFGYMLSLYSEAIQKSLHRVKDIRNEFAHVVSSRTFESQRISDLCKNFPSPKRMWAQMPPLSTRQAPEVLDQWEQARKHEEEQPDTPRSRYETFIKVCLQIFTLRYLLYQENPALPPLRHTRSPPTPHHQS